jgi:hypothetical protein
MVTDIEVDSAARLLRQQTAQIQLDAPEAYLAVIAIFRRTVSSFRLVESMLAARTSPAGYKVSG